MYELYECTNCSNSIPGLSEPADVSSFWKLRSADRHRSISRAWVALSTPIVITRVSGPGWNKSRKTSGPLFSPCAHRIANSKKSHVVPPSRRPIGRGAPAEIPKNRATIEDENYNIGSCGSRWLSRRPIMGPANKTKYRCFAARPVAQWQVAMLALVVVSCDSDGRL